MSNSQNLFFAWFSLVAPEEGELKRNGSLKNTHVLSLQSRTPQEGIQIPIVRFLVRSAELILTLHG